MKLVILLIKKRVITLEEEKQKQIIEIENLRKQFREVEQKMANIRKENVESEKQSRAQLSDTDSERKKLINEINNLKAEINSVRSQNESLLKNLEHIEKKVIIKYVKMILNVMKK